MLLLRRLEGSAPVEGVPTLQTLLGGRQVSTFTQNNKLYDVIVQLNPSERATPSDVSGLYVRGRGNELIQLSAVVKVARSPGAQGEGPVAAAASDCSAPSTASGVEEALGKPSPGVRTSMGRRPTLFDSTRGVSARTRSSKLPTLPVVKLHW